MRKIIFYIFAATIFFPFYGSAQTYGSNVFVNGTSSASAEYPSYEAYLAFDQNESTRWVSTNTNATQWLKYILDTPRTIDKIGFKPDYTVSQTGVKDFSFQGSNNGSDWDTLIATTTNPEGGDWVYYETDAQNETEYTQYRIVVADSYTTPDYWKSIIEFEGYECISSCSGPATTTITYEDLKNSAAANVLNLVFFLLEAAAFAFFLWISWKGVKKWFKIK